jgi:hypothetical protein
MNEEHIIESLLANMDWYWISRTCDALELTSGTKEHARDAILEAIELPPLSRCEYGPFRAIKFPDGSFELFFSVSDSRLPPQESIARLERQMKEIGDDIRVLTARRNELWSEIDRIKSCQLVRKYRFTKKDVVAEYAAPNGHSMSLYELANWAAENTDKKFILWNDRAYRIEDIQKQKHDDFSWEGARIDCVPD